MKRLRHPFFGLFLVCALVHCGTNSTPAPDGGVTDAGQLDAGEVPDAGLTPDAGAAPDAGPTSDAGPSPDAGPAPDAGPQDSGVPPEAHIAFGINAAGDGIGPGRTQPFAIERTYHQAGETTLTAQELALVAKGIHLHTSVKGSGTWLDVAAGKDDAALKALLQDAHARGGTAVYFSFHHEMDGDDTYGTPQDYVAAARHVWQLAQDLGINHGAGGNLYWVWTVTSYGTHTAGYGFPQRVTPYYPGDAFVDFLGDDVYNFQGCTFGGKNHPFHTFHDEMQPMLDWRVAQGHLKRVMLPEVGASRVSTSMAQPAWIDAMHTDLKAADRAPVVALEYFQHSNDGCVGLLPESITAYKALGADPYFALATPLP